MTALCINLPHVTDLLGMFLKNIALFAGRVMYKYTRLSVVFVGDPNNICQKYGGGRNSWN